MNRTRMTRILGENMSDKSKRCLVKPSVPARPKNLVVLNSKHLPKPPETFSTEDVTNFIRDLNLDVKDEVDVSESGQLVNDNASNSDLEEDADGYLEPISLSSTDFPQTSQSLKKDGGRTDRKKFGYEEKTKLSNIFRRVISRNNSGSSETPELEETKPQISQRPLPSPPVEAKPEVDVTSMPWYKNVDRQEGAQLVENGIDGYFILRPSSKADTYLVLTLWYQNRVYNVPIRRKTDGTFALGSPKRNELCFDSVESLVKHCQSRTLVLFRDDMFAGKTVLTVYPP